MTVGLVILGIFIIIGVAAQPMSSALSERHNNKKAVRSKDVFSEPARRIVDKSKSLPIELQGDDVAGMVKALDIKYGIQAVNDHFRISDYKPAWDIPYEEKGREYPNLFTKYVFSWHGNRSCDHFKTYCKFPEYRKMAVAIEQVEAAKKAQDRALEIGGVQHNLDAIEAWTNRLREERNIINEITEELT